MFSGTPVCWGFCSHLFFLLCGGRFCGTSFFSVENLGNIETHEAGNTSGFRYTCIHDVWTYILYFTCNNIQLH